MPLRSPRAGYLLEGAEKGAETSVWEHQGEAEGGFVTVPWNSSLVPQKKSCVLLRSEVEEQCCSEHLWQQDAAPLGLVLVSSYHSTHSA